MKKILTVVIPAYNVSKYIGECLDSLVKESLEALEVLVIDDGSKDDTLSIAQKYEECYPEIIQVIHKENGGHGSTINTGLKYASGTYFKVLDGDDWIDISALKKLLQKLEKGESDIYITNVVQLFPNKTIIQKFFTKLKENKLYKIDELPQIDYLTMGSIAVKTDILKQHHVHITENCFYVDIEYNTYCAAYADTIMRLDLDVYMYRMGNESQSVTKKNMYKRLDMLEKVSLGMASYFDTLKDIGKTREELLLLRIGKLTKTTMLLYMADEDGIEGFDRLNKYCCKVNKVSNGLYSYILKKWPYIFFLRANKAFFMCAGAIYRKKFNIIC